MVQYNIRTNLKDTECEDVKWSHLAQNRTQLLALVNI
jgi:hypothetical protein